MRVKNNKPEMALVLAELSERVGMLKIRLISIETHSTVAWF